MIVFKHTLHPRLGVTISHVHLKLFSISSSKLSRVTASFESSASLSRYLRSCSLVMSSNEVTSSMNPSSMYDVKCCASTQYFSSIEKTASVVVVEASSPADCSYLARQTTVRQYWSYSLRTALMEAGSVSVSRRFETETKTFGLWKVEEEDDSFELEIVMVGR